MKFTIKKSSVPAWGYEITAPGFHNIAPTVESAVIYLKDRYGYDVQYSIVRDAEEAYVPKTIVYNLYSIYGNFIGERRYQPKSRDEYDRCMEVIERLPDEYELVNVE